MTARLYRHATDPMTFKSWLDYVDTYLAVWVMGYEKGRNLCDQMIEPQGNNLHSNLLNSESLRVKR